MGAKGPKPLEKTVRALDTARLFVMFASPPEQTLEWNDAGVEGAHRFLKRLWAFGAHGSVRTAVQFVHSPGFTLGAERVAEMPALRAIRREVHSVLRQISHDYDRMQYNTVVSGCMKLLNTLERVRDTHYHGSQNAPAFVVEEGLGILLRALYPACPHIAHGLWAGLGYAQAQGDLLDAPWPAVDEAALAQDEIELVLQIAGKMRGSIKVAATADKAAIEAAALAAPEFAKFGEGRAAKKVVLVPGRLVNVVV